MTEGFKRRTPSRWGEGGALKEEILAAAARMLMESGREGDLSLRAVAREVGISAPSVYLHFKDRAELVATLTRRAYERLVADLRGAAEGAGGGGPREALRAMARRYCRFALDNPQRYRLMFGIEWIEGPRPRDGVDRHPSRMVYEVWVEAVRACRGDRTGAADDERVARLLWFSLHGIVAMSVSMPFATSGQAMEEMADDLLDLAMTK
ncbi:MULTISPECIES: TetR/AcrR family transcriptional regulator [Streptomyces]|uniref:AcrR family transcriptional regulator n=1 Tax=Streptomyces demainii TaxID=588122 RepID=A0ABT9KJP4_9ACTN|nr:MULTISPECIES: TetR/AcrR family transcriptional regulator [Streptomyces]MBW8088004.1 TetR/AcrR family transcriptional regulator [Streptomyces hygroscopicus subsp. hygroscopicus]MDN3055696.1 TetR/AcrR family transcriptional regulator [Streptomyces sp. SRF1]MDP9608614.1 AcrR family transcriptional regulator [Streptomyces demainii]